MRFQRSRRGSAISETGPALFMFFIIIFFPLLDVMGMGAQFACAWYHNHLMLQELAVRHKTEGDGTGQINNAGSDVHKEVYRKFSSTGVAVFAGITQVTDDVTFPTPAANTDPEMVRCTTTVEGKPFISLPFLGFTKTKFTVSGEATREVKERSLS